MSNTSGYTQWPNTYVKTEDADSMVQTTLDGITNLLSVLTDMTAALETHKAAIIAARATGDRVQIAAACFALNDESKIFDYYDGHSIGIRSEVGMTDEYFVWKPQK